MPNADARCDFSELPPKAGAAGNSGSGGLRYHQETGGSFNASERL